MKKTGLQIQDDVYAIIDVSNIKKMIAGKLYKAGMRPINAQSEDAVVSFLTGINGQIQAGVVNVNIYVPDITIAKGQSVCNLVRCRALETELNKTIYSIKSSEYRLIPDSIISTFPEPEIRQHFINARIKFTRIAI